jgi:hypothetical protein
MPIECFVAGFVYLLGTLTMSYIYGIVLVVSIRVDKMFLKMIVSDRNM